MPPARHHPQRSNIRTRSQQHTPNVPVDLTASPFKAIRRQIQIATVVQTAQQLATTVPPTEEESTLDSSHTHMHGKRLSSAFFPSHPHDWKRQRVSAERDQDIPLSVTSSQTAHTNCPSTPPPSRDLLPTTDPVHINLTRISQSPSKHVSSPTKLFKITTHLGGTVQVPVSPARRPTLNPEVITEPKKMPINSSHTEIIVSTHTSDVITDAVRPQLSPCLTPAIISDVTDERNDVQPHPVEPFSQASEALVITSNVPRPFTPFEISPRPHETLVAGPSRLPKFSFKISALSDNAAKTPMRAPNSLAPTLSSLAKTKPLISPMRLRSRPQLKAKLGIKDRAPAGKLALKRTIRRVSLNKEKVKGVSSPSLKPAGVFVNVTDKSIKEAKQATLNAFFQRRPNKSKQSPPPMSSPSKPAPLVALSTALKKLEVSAPLPPPRPVMNSGSMIESEELGKTQNMCEKVSETDVSESNLATDGSPKITSKVQLPLRLPTNPDINGRKVSPSKKPPVTTTSPTSTALSKQLHDESDKPSEVVDVETFSGIMAEEEKENRSPLEFLVPLTDESSSTSMKFQALAQISPSRRASQASLALSQTLSAPNKPPTFPQARSISASQLQLNARSPVKTRGKTKPPAPAAEPVNQSIGKRLNARMPGSLDVLKDCVIFVDVKTEEGEDAAPLFVDMLRGLGARILSKPGKSCTHLVFKAGLPSTVIKYKLLPQPKPLVVSIGWVVECVEKRSHVEETRFLVSLDDFDITGGSLRRRSLTMQPKQIRALILGQLDPSDSGDSGTNVDASFTSEESSAVANLSPPQRTAVTDNLPPLERARQRSQSFFRRK